MRILIETVRHKRGVLGRFERQSNRSLRVHTSYNLNNIHLLWVDLRVE